MKANKKILGLAIICATMSGCSLFKAKEYELKKQEYTSKTYNMEAPSDREIYETLAQAAKNIDKSVEILASVNSAAKSETMTYDQIRQARWQKTYTPLGLEREVTIRDWNGPVGPIFTQIEKITNYKIKILNEAPAYGNFVSINAIKEPAINIIRKVNADLGERIKINILEDEKIIEVSYVK
jgi:hypothetical protein